jgi:hypothetical protein
MKRFTLLTFLLFAFLGAFAQNISVKSFKALPMDMTASSLEGKRIDQNGDVAALIKVVTSETGFTFEGGALGIVDTRQRNGEIWVWVPRGLRKITVLHQKLGVLRDYRFPNEIEAERTYEMVLTTGKVKTYIEEETTEQWLVFEIMPHDAILEVDDKMWPVSAEGTARSLVPFGTYTYRVQAQNYHPEVGRVEVNDPENSQVITVTLEPNFGWIEVPGDNGLSGSAVYIDNALIGKAPCKSEALKSGSHNVRILKELYEPYTTTVTVNDNETTRVAPVLTGDFAHLTLQVDADAEIWVNDELKGTRTWTGDLPSGTYRIECKQEGHEPTTTKKTVTNSMNGEVITLEAPIPIYGSLNVESTPDLATLYIDGKEMGKTPKLIGKILVGEHEVRLVKKGYTAHTETVTVTQGVRAQVKAKLKADGSTPAVVEPQQLQTPQPEIKQPATVKPESSVFFVMANAAYSLAPQTSFGLTMGSVKRWGWYASVGTNFKYVRADYECATDGTIPSDANTYYRYTQKETMRLSVAAGALAKVAKPVYVYFGAGYGVRNLLWHFEGDIVNGVAKNTAYSHEGVALDAGLMLHIGHFSGSLGVQTVNFGYVEAKFGLGMNF